MLDQAEEQIARMVEERPGDPAVMATVHRLREEIESGSGPYLFHVRERFNCILGSLGLIPSDNEGEPCARELPTITPAAGRFPGTQFDRRA